ncbi:hypothetical protein CBR_g18832 [Chara braunii]|uniref:Uncharacterized protein n=1 Tax=Chara braunii TaxID=69332 RepID=A0A388KWH5_CHABU|nr:hypothetical protein CBR_g18832 [Chara braunii]|eukprot:GBG74420.1 hypothetical protein CBR_g18832 [Chara braunii]
MKLQMLHNLVDTRCQGIKACCQLIDLAVDGRALILYSENPLIQLEKLKRLGRRYMKLQMLHNLVDTRCQGIKACCQLIDLAVDGRALILYSENPLIQLEKVETRGGVSTTSYTEQEEEAARSLAEQKAKKEKKEVVKQAKKLALLQEQAAKRKKLEEELERVKKEEEEKLKAVEAEEEEEEKKAEEVPVIRKRGESSGTKKEEDPWLEKKVSEWVANLSLGKDEEAMMYVPRAKHEVVVKEWEAKKDPLKRQNIEEEKKLE